MRSNDQVFPDWMIWGMWMMIPVLGAVGVLAHTDASELMIAIPVVLLALAVAGGILAGVMYLLGGLLQHGGAGPLPPESESYFRELKGRVIAQQRGINKIPAGYLSPESPLNNAPNQVHPPQW